MSVTLHLSQQEIQPAYNEVISVISSTNSGKQNFSFVTELFIDGVLASKRNTPTDLNGFGVIDSHRILENSVKLQSDFDVDNTSTFQRVQETYANYQLYFGEEFFFEWPYTTYSNSGGFSSYSSATAHHFTVGEEVFMSGDTGINALNVTQTVTSVPNSTSIVTDLAHQAGTSSGSPISFLDDFSNTQILSGANTSLSYIYNGVEKYQDYRTYDSNDFVLSSTTSQFLTSIPDEYRVTLDDKNWLYAYNLASPSTYKINALRVFSYDSSGSLTGEYRIVNTFSGSSDENKFLYIGVGANQLNNTTSTVNVISGSLPIVSTSDASYDVRAYNTSNGNTSKAYTFNIKDADCKHDQIRFLFLDRRGSFITYIFDKMSKTSTRIKRKEYKKNYGSYDSSTNTWGYNDMERGFQTYDTEITEEVTANSDWVSQAEVPIISDLINSSQVFVIDASGEILPINITTSRYENKKKVNKKLFNYTIKFKYSFNNTVQRS